MTQETNRLHSGRQEVELNLQTAKTLPGADAEMDLMLLVVKILLKTQKSNEEEWKKVWCRHIKKNHHALDFEVDNFFLAYLKNIE